MKINSNQSRDDGHFSSLGNEKNSFRGIENNYKNGFNLNIFQPAGEGTPNSESIRDAVEESMIVRRAEIDIDRIAGEVRLRGIAVHYNTMHISSIGKKLAFDGRIRPWGTIESNVINMIGLHQLPSDMPEGFHEGTDEVILALYKINEVIFKAITVYPYKILNIESGKFEYKKNSFMKFIPHERNEHDKFFESGFYRSYLNIMKNIPESSLTSQRILRTSICSYSPCFTTS